MSRERGIGYGALASNDAIKSSPVSVRLTDGKVTPFLGEVGALPWGGRAEKNDCGEVSERMGSGALSRASLRAFNFSAR